MGILSKIFGDPNDKFLKSLQPIVEKINSFEPVFEKLSVDQLKEKTREFKARLQKGETLDDILPEAFAAVREASKRTLLQRHFDVQLMGGIALHQGKIAEMRTGEGKTLTATLPAYLNALGGSGVHIVTVNDYLAKRDMIWMGQIYGALGLSTGCICNESGYIYDKDYINTQSDQLRDKEGSFKVVQDFLKPVGRKDAYLADITYGQNNEFGFDYLRDNMVYEKGQEAQRGYNFAIVDEVDSILIDEARVPLIISGQAEDATEKYYNFARIVSSLEDKADYQVDEKLKSVSFTEQGQNKVVRALGSDPWLDNDITSTHQLEAALKAKALFLKDRDYMIKNGEVLIIDEFTGRILPGRRWSAGLHQAVEAKEGTVVQPESIAMATITFQNYFRMYKKLAGMTGTALTSAEEFDKVYKLEVVSIPTNKTTVRKDFTDKVYKSEQGKYKAMVKEIQELHKKGQPVLVGTRSVEKNEYVSKLLEVSGIPHNVLNAKNHEREGEIIAQAGKSGAVTIATNMAGRGVDILLGGSPQDPEQQRRVRELGGLHVIGTERHEARRIDNQLRGRSGRQGDPGSTQFFVSLEDDLMRIFGGDRIKSLMDILKMPEDEPIQAGMVSGAIESAQEKIEGFNFDARHRLLEYDDVLNKHREIIYKRRKEILELSDLKPKILEIFKKANLSEEDYNKKEKEVGPDNMRQLERIVSLRIIDLLWQEHLSYMDHVRDSVGLRAYSGRDPLVEYKSEGHKAFGQLLNTIDANIAENIIKAGIQVKSAPQTQNVVSGKNKVGRNDQCPCGSGKKYKHCHGKS